MLAIIQARMSSARLPGKMLTELCGRTLLSRVVDRVSMSRSLTDVIVATSNDSSDDELATFCSRNGIKCRRGPLDNVAQRLKSIALQEGAPAFVRISGDSPFIDPAIVDRAVTYYELGECDLATNVFTRTFPKGQSVEVLRLESFERLCDTLKTLEHKEHVTRAYYEDPNEFRIVSFTSGVNVGHVNLCVDTPEDLQRARAIIEETHDRPCSWQTLLDVLQRVAR